MALITASCGDRSSSSASSPGAGGATAQTSAALSAPRAAAAGDSPRKPNPHGRVPVLEYHLIGDSESMWMVEREHFKRQLQLLYDRGYRPVTMKQVLDKDFSEVPPGMSPVVFTFDDASPEQFSYVERNGRLEIDPKSVVGIWTDFQRRHPDWKSRAVFCTLNGAGEGHNFFGDKGIQGQKTEWRHQKVKWLADQGHEICNHTLWHAQLSKYPDAFVQEQIARGQMGIDSAVPGYRVRTFALPQGLWPKNRSLAWKGSWTDPKSKRTVSYEYDAVLLVAGGPSRSPYDPKFDPHAVTRVIVHGNELEKMLDQLDRAKDSTQARFVAGGAAPRPATAAR
ncbi:MAG: polysaccharide deacetylase family protein [Gemmatimonadota bacterium]|nr:polysaccharide deacetylase family protein [Gemmatimonadota bacterium]